MRINLTKKDLVNLVYMQLGFSKQISESLLSGYDINESDILNVDNDLDPKDKLKKCVE